MEENKECHEKLETILEQLNQGVPPHKVRKDVGELLKEVDPEELSSEDRQLIDKKLPNSFLDHMCEEHIARMDHKLEKLKAKVSREHPLSILIEEHDQILEILDELETINQALQTTDNLTDYQKTKLRELGEKLLETEKHHQREEEALFPLLEKAGITGPVRVMELEHQDLWPKKEEIHKLAHNLDSMNFEDFKEELNHNVESLISTLRDHIYRENKVLYPISTDYISDSKWDEIKEEFKEIGYCSFTQDFS